MYLLAMIWNKAIAPPERSVLYQLGENETLFKAGFTFQTDRIHFYGLIADKNKPWPEIDDNTKEFAPAAAIVDLIIDGKIEEPKIGVKQSLSHCYTCCNSEDIKINLLNNNKSYYTYQQDNAWFLKYNGKKYGPYEDVRLEYNWLGVDEGIVVYKQMGQWFVLLPDEKIIGPYNNAVEDVYYDQLSQTTIVADNAYNVFYNGRYLDKFHNAFLQIYRFISNDKGFNAFQIINAGAIDQTYINGALIGRISPHYKITDEGKSAYIRYADGRSYLTINDREFGGFEKINGYDINNQGGFIYRYLEDEKEYVNVNGKVVGVYDNIDDYIVHVDGSAWMGNFAALERPGYFQGNSKDSFGGGVDYDEHFESPMMNDKGDFIYAYRNKGEFYLAINGRSEGPYTGTWKPYIDDKGNYVYICALDGKTYVVINGKRGEALQNATLPYMTRTGHYIFQFSKGKKSYLNIDGRLEGPYEVIGASKINEKGEYAYIFSNKNSSYACINGQYYKEPVRGGEWQLRETVRNGFEAQYYLSLGHEKITYNQLGEIVNWEMEGAILQNVLKSKNGKTMLLFNRSHPYVLINHQKYGNGEILAVDYNQKLNVFRWSMLEDKELVVYEYKL